MNNVKKVYVFDNQGDFENILNRYLDIQRNWAYAASNGFPEAKQLERSMQEAASEFADFCMHHLCVVPNLTKCDVLVLSELKRNMNTLRTCLEKL